MSAITTSDSGATPQTTMTPKSDLEGEQPIRPRLFARLDELVKAGQDITAKRVNHDLSREFKCTEARIRQLKQDYIRNKKNSSEGSPSSPSPQQITKEADSLFNTPKGKPTQATTTGLPVPEAACHTCKQSFRKGYPTCSECGRKVIPDRDILDADDFKNLLTTFANMALTKLGADKLTKDEIETGSKCLGDLAAKYRWTLFGFLPEISAIAWGAGIVISRLPQIQEAAKKRKAEAEAKKEDKPKPTETTEKNLTMRELPKTQGEAPIEQNRSG